MIDRQRALVDDWTALWAVFVGGFMVLPLHVVTRLAVRAAVRGRYRRPLSR